MLEGLVTFGDGITARVFSRRTLSIDSFSRFKNVLHVNGLKANLISISKNCDLNFNVNFNREKCVVHDTDSKCVWEGFCSLSNC